MLSILNKNKEVLFHVLFWIGYFLYPYIRFSTYNSFEFEIVNGLIEVSFLTASVYSFSYLYFNKGLLKLAILGFVALLLAWLYIDCVVLKENCNCDPFYCFFNDFLLFLFINLFFAAISALKINYLNKQKLKQIEQEKTSFELETLKSQINPHFLFNSLNMIYSASLNKDDEVSEKILMLSENLHYVLHEGKKKEVTILEEYNFIKDYISLFEMRFKDKISVELSYISDNDFQKIPPLLLVPFIENALKFTSNLAKNTLPIPVFIGLKEGKLLFKISNPYSEREYATENFLKGGIGISNVKKRLEILYPKKYILDIKTVDQTFFVELNINLI